jgi:transcriptional antiterminator RfaH
MALGWYVLRTEPRAEYLAAAELARDGFEIYFPRVKSPQDRIGRGDSPLFPGYLFLRFDLECDRWPSLRLRHRVSGCVSFGGEVPSLPDPVINELMERVEAINRGGGLWHRFRAGEKVRVIGHNIDSLAEVIEEASSPQARARVLLSFMGRLVQARVPGENLRPVPEQVGQRQRLPRRTRGGGRWIRGFGARTPVRA